VTLAYTFWHRARPEIDPAGYEAGLQAFHQRLSAVPIPGFRDSWTLRVPDLPWQPGGGYEDWYLVDDFAALGVLAEHAVDSVRTPTHDQMARSVRDGAGGLYALLGETGETSGPGDSGRAEQSGWVGWFTKQPGVGYQQLRADLTRSIEAGLVRAVWQRQLVLGPAPEFRVLAPGPVPVSGADLQVGVPVVRSG
jgi:hypothetical protein